MKSQRKAIIVLTIFVISFTAGLIDSLGDTKVSRCKRCSATKVLAVKGQPCSFEFNGQTNYGTFVDTLEGQTCEWAFTLSNCTSQSVRCTCSDGRYSSNIVVGYVCTN